MFERFTDRARRVVVLAQEEARLLNHNYIGTEHILLGMLKEEEGIAAKALGRLGVGRRHVLEQVVELIGEGQQSPSGHIPFTPRAKKVLELSLREALQLGHNYIGTEHILLGLVREGEGVAAQVLVKLDAELPKVRKTVISLLSGPGGAAARELEPSGGVRRGSARSSDPTSLVLDRISRSDPDELELYRRLIERIQTRDRTSSGGDQIRISGIEVMAHHGVYPEEKEIGQRFLIGLELTLDLSKAAGSDQLEDTVDYERLVLEVTDRVKLERWNLLERVAERIAELVLADNRVASVVITVSKPDLQLSSPTEAVQVRVQRSR